jgi:hypothetical protein
MPLAAERLASDTGIKVIEQVYFWGAFGITVQTIKEYVDLELFAQSRKIELAIKNHSCAEALAWCKENGSSLKKIKVYLCIALDSRNKSTRNIAKSLMHDVRAL